jgi:hypothetical protein
MWNVVWGVLKSRQSLKVIYKAGVASIFLCLGQQAALGFWSKLQKNLATPAF